MADAKSLINAGDMVARPSVDTWPRCSSTSALAYRPGSPHRELSQPRLCRPCLNTYKET